MGERKRELPKGKRAHVDDMRHFTKSSDEILKSQIARHFDTRVDASDIQYIRKNLTAHFQGNVSNAVLLDRGVPSVWTIPWRNTHLVFSYNNTNKQIHLLTAEMIGMQVTDQPEGTLYEVNGNKIFRKHRPSLRD